MYYTLLILQCLGILFMFYELIHISRQRPSKFQTLLLFLVGAILINTYGYTLEITATGKELALQAVRISYLAKPYPLFNVYFCNEILWFFDSKSRKTYSVFHCCLYLGFSFYQ